MQPRVSPCGHLLLADAEALVGLINDSAVQNPTVWDSDARPLVAVHGGVEPSDLSPRRCAQVKTLSRRLASSQFTKYVSRGASDTTP